jgi:hypothetical protein
MEDLCDLSYEQFFSYKDADNFIYGFDLVSIYNLLFKNKTKNGQILNPYNRSKIPSGVFKNVKDIFRLSKLLGIKINLVV